MMRRLVPLVDVGLPAMEPCIVMIMQPHHVLHVSCGRCDFLRTGSVPQCVTRWFPQANLPVPVPVPVPVPARQAWPRRQLWEEGMR